MFLEARQPALFLNLTRGPLSDSDFKFILLGMFGLINKNLIFLYVSNVII